MHDAGKIIAGLVIFLVLVTSPLWYNALSAAPVQAPELSPPPNGSKECVEATEYMRASHMDLLNQWRDEVVRNGPARLRRAPLNGRTFDMSLSRTCMDCHSNKAEFCDRCHTYLAVSPYCWDCHVEPKTREALVMDSSRRGFLKIAGLVAGRRGRRVGADGSRQRAEVGSTAHGDQPSGSGTSAGHGHRPAQVLRERRAPASACIEACHEAHNVPDFGDDPKDEIKWIWTEEFETAFPSQELHYLRTGPRGQADPAAVQPLRQPPLRPGLPDPGDLEAGVGRHRDDGLAPLHRLPVLHRRLSLRLAQLQLARPAAAHRRDVTTEFPTRMRGVVEKCTFCEERLAKGRQPACVEACEQRRDRLRRPQRSGVRRCGACSRERLTIRRKPGLGTQPEVYYIVEDPRTLIEVAPARSCRKS